jgi:hypothetical protein
MFCSTSNLIELLVIIAILAAVAQHGVLIM